jgi:hypothetical protein
VPIRESLPDYSLFLDIIQVLERIGAPYMLIGAFAATAYGLTRTTYDIDIVVDLSEAHIIALAEAYPAPRYYADHEQMRDSVRRGIMFKIIDMERGEKADIVPLTMTPAYHAAFERRIRQPFQPAYGRRVEMWCARPEDVIIGKLRAWQEGRSRKHESDVFEMLTFHYQGSMPTPFDELLIDRQAEALGHDVAALWNGIKMAARRRQ